MGKRNTILKTHPRVQQLTKHICEMVAVDSQLFSFVENEGFKRLMATADARYSIPTRQELSHKLIPDLYKNTVSEVNTVLENVANISVTIDFWSSRANDDYMSLTCHFLKEENLKCLCLEAIPFTQDHHTAENKKIFLKQTLDNAANITSAVQKLKISGIPCTAHTIQLIVKHGCFNLPSVSNTIAKSRRVVASFKQSLVAIKALHRAQDMIERLLEQKSAVSLCSSELNLFTTLTSCDWNTIGNIEPIPQLFSEVTKTVSKSSCSISEVILILNSLRRAIESDNTMGLQNMKNDIIHHLDAYYPIETTETNRFKNKIFSSKRNANTAVAILTEEEKTNCNQSSSADCHDDSANSSCSPPRK
ncbi:hypothetical protein PR048_001974 [Dryococelus australis]|uniref:Zinc finger BED domain-containing protein 4 n=1 Tax=Dryococelus australis TaxID=614101 RepID=A0ABQ9IIU5_9NEOP|nr:hypothetical protein PR048_001974 [Dryococelus australis]